MKKSKFSEVQIVKILKEYDAVVVMPWLFMLPLRVKLNKRAIISTHVTPPPQA